MDQQQSDLLTIQEAASFLRLRPATIRAWVLKRKLMYVKLGGRVFLRQQDLQRLLERSLVQVAAKTPARHTSQRAGRNVG